MSAGEIWVGVDLGTQSVRAVALDESGELLAAARCPLDSWRDSGRHEQDPKQWWDAAAQVLRGMTGELGAARARIRAVATCGTSGTFTVLDAHGTVASAGVMYDDSRAVGREDGPVDRASVWLREQLGYRVQPTWALPKLAALVADGALPTVARVIHQPDVIAASLTGGPVATDTSSALKSGVDPRAVRWPDAVLAAVGEAVSLPDVVLPGTVLGAVSEYAAERTGLPRGTAVVAGATDGCAAQLASGALDVGDWNCVLGTTLVCKGVSRELVPDRGGATYSHRSPDGTWLPGGASSTGLGVLSALFGGADLDALSRTGLRGMPPVCYPLAGTGERFPFLAPGARGFALSGGHRLPITAATRDSLGDSAMLGALLTGVAYTERLCFEVLAATGYPVGGRIRFAGGATRNPLLTALRARMLGRTVEVPANPEPAAGMAILAAWGCAPGADTLAARVSRMVRVESVTEPGGTPGLPLAADLDEGYRRFRSELHASGWLVPP
ncbi:MAG: FGGY-family carbohydrate kinase [Sciscionella sp.]